MKRQRMQVVHLTMPPAYVERLRAIVAASGLPSASEWLRRQIERAEVRFSGKRR